MSVDRGAAAVHRAATAKERARQAKMRLARLKSRTPPSKRDLAFAREAAEQSAVLAVEAEQWFTVVNASHRTSRERRDSRLQGDRNAATRRVADALGQLGRLHQRPQDEQYLATVAELCAWAFGPGCEASVTVGAPDAPTARASSGTLAEAEDEAQRQRGCGPTADAWSRCVPVWSNGREEREGSEGSAVLALPVVVDQGPLAVVTVYATDPAPWGQLEADLLHWLTSGVAALLLHVEDTQRLRTENRQLKQALTSRATIDQAKGIVMAQGHCGPDEAFDRLKEASRNRNVKLRDIARTLLAETQRQRRSQRR